MAFVPPKDRVLEHSISNSQTVFDVTGSLDLSYNAFSAWMSVGDTTIGAVVEQGTAFKVGLLTYSATNQITVTTAYDGKGTFSSAGIKEVFMGLPSADAIIKPTLPAILRGFISGLTTANNAVTPNTKIDVAAGVAADDTQSIIIQYTGGTFDLTTIGALGLDAGSLASNKTYHMFVIAKSDGTSSLLASLSATLPTFPSGYTLKKRIGGFLTDASAHVIPYLQFGLDFILSVPSNDYGVNNPGTSAILTALKVPTGVVVKAKFFYYLQAGDGGRRSALITSPAQAATAPSAGTASFIAAGLSSPASGLTQAGFETWTDTSGQIRHQLDGSGPSTSVFIVTNGWTDPL